MQPRESKTNYHFFMSLFKSAIRIIGCIYLAKGDLFKAGALLGFAETLGIAEEM